MIRYALWMKLLLVWLLAMVGLVEAYAGVGSERQEERFVVALEDVYASSIACAVLDTEDGFGDFNRQRHVWWFSDEVVIGATPEHPFFSVDRQAYIAVGELHPGEEVMTAGENGIKAWEVLSHTGLRTNIRWLEDVSKWIDDGLILTSTVTKVTIKKAGEVVGEISGDLLKVKYPHFGGDVVCHSAKTTTVVGRFEGNISIIKDSQLWQYGENTGGVNILNDLNWTWPINEQWLTNAANRGDIIRAVSDPNNVNNIWINGIIGGNKTNFGKEVDLLNSLDYYFDPINFQFIK